MNRRFSIALLICLVYGLLIACSDDNGGPVPDAATQVAGQYELTKLQLDSAGISLYNYNLPLTVGSQSLSGTIVARRDSASVVYVSYTIKQTGQTDYNDTFGQLSLSGSAAPYDLYYGKTKVGTTDGKTFTIDYSYKDNKGTTYREVYSGLKK